MRSTAFPIIVLFSLIHTLAAAAEDAPVERTDPAVFVTPKQSPEFRELLKGRDWDRQFSAATARLGDLEALRQSSFPEAGILLLHVDENGMVANLGIKVGEVISEVDSVTVNQKHIREFRRNTTAYQEHTIVGIDGIARQVTVAPGNMGFNSMPVVYPERIYLRRGARSMKWDAFAAVGAANCCCNPDLAETAWRHAVAAGYTPDFISDYCGAQIAWRQARLADSVGFCGMLSTRKDIPEALDVEHFTRQIALANFKIEQGIAGRMSLEPGEPLADAEAPNGRLQQLLEIHRALPESERLAAAPSEVAEYVKTNLLKNMEPRFQTTDEAENRIHTEAANILFNQSEWLPLVMPVAQFRLLAQAPTVPSEDVELIARVKLHLTNHATTSSFLNAMHFGLLNADQPENTTRPGLPTSKMLRVSIEPFGLLQVYQGMGNAPILQQVWLADEVANDRQFTLRLIHTAHRDEVWVDRRRVFYVPSLDHPKMTGFILEPVSINAEIKVDFTRLDPTQVGN
jgi:hypothetical protein